MKKNPEAHHYISRRLADTDLYELAKKIEPLAEKIGFLHGNYTKFEKQVYYSQLRKNHQKTEIHSKHLIYIKLYAIIEVFLGSILGSPLKAFPLSMISENWFSSLFRTFL